MNRTTLVFVALAAILGVAAWIVSQPEEVAPTESFVVEGYATASQLEAEAKRSMLSDPIVMDYPFDGIELTQADQRIVLRLRDRIVTGRGVAFSTVDLFDNKACDKASVAQVNLDANGTFTHSLEWKAYDGKSFWFRDGSTCKKAAKRAEWEITEPVRAAAVTHKVREIAQLFRDDTASAVTRAVKPEDQRRFHLDDARRIGLKLTRSGEVWRGVDLWVGKAERQDAVGASRSASAAVDTWVMSTTGDKAFRVMGKDLRSAIELELADLRDKKLFRASAGEVSTLTITAPDGRRVTVNASIEEKGAEGDAKAGTKTLSWRLSEPSGVDAIDEQAVKALVRAMVGLRAKAYWPEAPEGALGKSVWVATATRESGPDLSLTFGAELLNEERWAKVAGRDGEWVTLDTRAVEGLQKTVEDLRAKEIVSLNPEALTGFTVEPTGAEPLSLVKTATGWVFKQPKRVFSADPTSFFGSALSVKAERFARPDEVEAAKAALQSPFLVLSFLAGESRHELVFSAEIGGATGARSRWARYTAPGGAASDFFRVSESTATRYLKKPADFRAKKVFDVRPQALSRLEVIAPGGAEPLVLTRDDAGALRPVSLPPEAKLKTSAITAMASTFANLRVKGFFDDTKPSAVGLGAAEATVVKASLSDGKTLTLYISQQLNGSDPYGRAEGGLQTGVISLNNYQADNLRKSLADVVE